MGKSKEFNWDGGHVCCFGERIYGEESVGTALVMKAMVWWVARGMTEGLIWRRRVVW